MIQFSDIKFDCALYNGYKPCRYGNECAGCPHYQPLDVPAGVAAREAAAHPQPQPCVDKPDARVLIIKTGAMGDVLRTTSLLHAIKREWPAAHITWVTAENALSLLIANPHVSVLLALTPENAEKIGSQLFDVLINLEKEKEPLALAGRVTATRKLGYSPTTWGTPTVFNPESEYALLLGINDDLKFRLNSKTYPQIISEMAAMPYQRDGYLLGLTATSHRRRAELEPRLSPRPRIALNTGCGTVFRTKQWPVENWLELIDSLADVDADLLLLGGEAERDLNGQMLAAAPHLVDTGTGNSLEEFFGVVDACDLMVTSDTLGMHIAIALKKYVVALFGSTSHCEIDLFDRGEKVITDFPCSPCYLKTCALDPMCMQAMRGSIVAEAVRRGLAAIRPAGVPR
jgi:heptosyltransferase-2